MGLWEGLVGRETPEGRYRFEVCLEGREALALFQVWDTTTEQTWWGWVLALNLSENAEGMERWEQWVALLQEVRDRRVGRYRDWGTVPVGPQVALPFVLEALPTAAALPAGLGSAQAAAIALDVALAVARYHEGVLVRNWTGQIVGRRVLTHGNLELAHLYWGGDRPVLSGGGLRAAWADLRAVELAPLVAEGAAPEREEDVQAIGRLLAQLAGNTAPAPLESIQQQAIAGDYPHAMALAIALRAVIPQLQPWYVRWWQRRGSRGSILWGVVPLAAVGAGGMAGLWVPSPPARPPLALPDPIVRVSRGRPPSTVGFVPLSPKPLPPAVTVAPSPPPRPTPPAPVFPTPVPPVLPLTPPISQRPIAVVPPPPALPPARPAVPLLPAVESVSGDTIEVLLTAEDSPSLYSLWQSAEAAVGSAVERAFAESARSEVRVLAIAERNRQRIPVLVTQVRRQDWQANPDVRPQSRYLSAAAPLLGFGGPTRPATVAPALSPAQRPPTLVPGRSRRAPAPASPPAAPTSNLGIPTVPAPEANPNSSPETSDTR